MLWWKMVKVMFSDWIICMCTLALAALIVDVIIKVFGGYDE